MASAETRSPNDAECAAPSPARAVSRWAIWAAAAVIVLATLAAFGNSFTGIFILDDDSSIARNASIRQLWPISPALCPPHGAETVSGRPLLNLSLAVNYAVSGFEIWSYHAANLIIHILGALLLFGVLRRTFLLPTMSERWGPAATPLAMAIALLWAIHPLQTESVTYIIQRAESLVGLFYLLTLYCFVRGVGSTRAIGWQIGAAAACLLGMASKEVMVSAPLMVLLYDRTFCAGSFREAWRRRWGLYLGLAATWLLLAKLVISTGNRGGSAGFGTPIGSWEYLCTQFGAIAGYLRLSVWPHPLVLDYGVGTAHGASAIVPYAIVVGLLGAATAVALWRWPKAGFLGAWFFAILAPTSSVVPVATQTIAEHRMYLPLAAVMAGVVIGCCVVGRRFVGLRTTSHWVLPAAGYCLLTFTGAAFGILTFQRNVDYQSALSIWGGVVAAAPGNERAHYNFGMALAERKRVDESIAQYRMALEINPRYSEAYNNLGFMLAGRGQPDEAIACYRKALEVGPGNSWASSNLAKALAHHGQPDEAIRVLRKSLEIEADQPNARHNLGFLLSQQGRLAEAMAEWSEVIRLHPENTESLNELAWALATAPEASLRNGAKAVEMAERAVKLSGGAEPNFLDTLAAAQAEAGQFAEAIATGKQALALVSGESNARLDEEIRNRLKLYEAGTPFRDIRQPSVPSSGHP